MDDRLEKAGTAAFFAPTAIATLCKSTPEETLEKAFGDAVRSRNAMTVLRAIYEHGGKALPLLENIDRLDAYRLFSVLPIPFIYPETIERAPQHLEDKEVLGVQKMHEFTAAYLFSWELGITIRSGVHEFLEPAHDKAVVSERRYQMIRRMCELDMFEGANPAVQWILAEASECLLGLKAGRGKGAITANRTRYEAKNRYIKGLKGKLNEGEEEKHTYPDSFEEELTHYSRWIDARAREMSEEKTTSGRKFKRQYYKPYCNALTTHNSNQQNKYGKKLQSVGIERKRPGPDLGRKYHKD